MRHHIPMCALAVCLFFLLGACVDGDSRDTQRLVSIQNGSTQVGNPGEDERRQGGGTNEGPRDRPRPEDERTPHFNETTDERSPTSDDDFAIQDCNYGEVSWRGEEEDVIKLVMGSVYETYPNRGFRQHPEGEAHVRFEREEATILVLSSYEPTHWIIRAPENNYLLMVLVIGYHAQRVTAPEGVEVVVRSYEQGDRLDEYCALDWPGDSLGGCDTRALVEYAEESTGLTLSVFDSCYQATQFYYTD